MIQFLAVKGILDRWKKTFYSIALRKYRPVGSEDSYFQESVERPNQLFVFPGPSGAIEVSIRHVKSPLINGSLCSTLLQGHFEMSLRLLNLGSWIHLI